MLLLDSAIEAATITVYRDHLAPDTFHYLPAAPRVVAEDGKAGLGLLRWRGARTGALLSLEVDLALPDAALEAARAALEARIGGPVNLVPVLFREGRVRLSALGVESLAPAVSGEPAPAQRLVERVLGTTTPSLLGRQRASFVLELDPEGGALLAAALTGADLPVVVAYDLAFAGLRPARGVRARVDHSMAYTYLRARFAADTLLFRADLDREAEALVREGHITLEDVDHDSESDAAARALRRDQILVTLRELSETLFFRPAASPLSLGAAAGARGSALDAAWAKLGRSQLAFVLRGLEQREEQVLTYDLTAATVATARIAPQGALRLPAGADAAELVRDVELGAEPGPQRVRAYCLPDADWSAVQAITIDVRAGQEVRTLSLDPAVREATAVLPEGPLEHRVRIAARPDTEALGQPMTPPDPPFLPLAVHDLLVDPAALTGRRVLQVALGVIDLDVVPRARVRLALGDEAREILLDGARPSVSVPVWGNADLGLAIELLLLEGEPVRLAATVPPSQAIVLVNQPESLARVVTLVLRDPLDRYAKVIVEVEASEGATRRVFALDAASPEARWSVGRAPGAPRTFRYRVRKVGKDASVVDSGFQEGAGSLLLAGDLQTRVDAVEIVLAGAPRTLGAVLRLTSLAPPPDTEPTTTLLLEEDQLTARARLPFWGARHYRVEGSVFLESGECVVGPLDESGEVVILSLRKA